ncbi:hypothetical protein [Hymenobacter algoricola]
MATLRYTRQPSARPSRAAFNSALRELLRDPQTAPTASGASFMLQAVILESAAGFELVLPRRGQGQRLD